MSTENFVQPPTPESLQQMYARATELVTGMEIKPEDFVDLYSAENVGRDQSYVRERKGQFELQDKASSSQHKERIMAGKIFEAIMLDRGQSSGWFGFNSSIIKTAAYDDIKNGVDGVVEFRERLSEEFLALSIDVTFGQEQGSDKKLEGIREKIESGNLSTIKYFRNSSGTQRGELSRVPHVIVGSDYPTALELIKAWGKDDFSFIDSHPMQFQILEEILMQAKAFRAYALKVNRPEVAREYEKVEVKVGALLETRRSVVDDNGKRDKMFDHIKTYLAAHFK